MSTGHVDQSRRPWWAAVVGVTPVLVYAVGVAVAIWSSNRISAYPSDDPLWYSAIMVLGFGWFALVGGLVLARQPKNAMGWVLAAIPVTLGVASWNDYVAYQVIELGREPTLGLSLLAWPNNWVWYVVLGLVTVYIPLFFPSGRLLTPRWTVVAWLGAVGVGGTAIFGAVAGEIGFQVSQSGAGAEARIPNPLGIEGLAHVEQHPVATVFGVLFLTAVVGALASLVVRYRRSRGIERQQMKWLVFAVSLIPVMLVAEIAGTQFAERLQGIGFLAVLNAVPLAIALAILRYRLYDIDRIINRAVVYTVLTLTLGGMYWGLVIGLQLIVRPFTPGSDLAVAASTLAVAAAFGPVRSRVQRVVDRRFNRARYDAQKTVETLAQRLRDDVDLEVLRTDLLAVVGETMRPRSVDLWAPDVSEGGAR